MVLMKAISLDEWSVEGIHAAEARRASRVEKWGSHDQHILPY